MKIFKRFGKWYYDIDCEKFRNHNAFTKLETPHIELHKAAKEAVIAYENGDIVNAESTLSTINACSVKVVTALNEIKKYLRSQG